MALDIPDLSERDLAICDLMLKSSYQIDRIADECVARRFIRKPMCRLRKVTIEDVQRLHLVVLSACRGYNVEVAPKRRHPDMGY
jgi:hypothetical protein